MQRINIFLEEKQIKFIKSLPGTLSDNVRQFVSKSIKEIENRSVSSSATKGGGKDE
jgi:hypothetical protein